MKQETGEVEREEHESAAADPNAVELSVVMPCLNEALTLGRCIDKALRCMQEIGIQGEVVIADNGSTDGSIEIAETHGARVVHASTRGYGAALKTGIRSARGIYVIMGDCDESYDFTGLAPFVAELRKGHDLVMGNRFKGGIQPGAMPLHHRYFGNPLLTFLGRTFFKAHQIGDFYCGLRGFRKDSILGLGLQSNGMEFALEMVIKSNMHGLKITEVPTTLTPDGRDRAPHLKSFKDGWRSLRLYLLMAPRWLFAYPGALLLVTGLVLCMRLLIGPIELGSFRLDYHTLVYSTAAVIIGFQMLLMFTFAKLLAVECGLHPPLTRLGFLRDRSVLSRFSFYGLGMMGIGVTLGLFAMGTWSATGFQDLHSTVTLKLVTMSVLFLVLAGQTTMAGFFFGLYNLLEERRGERLSAG